MPFENGVNWQPFEPDKRGRHATFESALDAVARDILTEKSAFFDSLVDSWRRLFPDVPARPGRFEDGILCLYVANAPTSFLLHRRLLTIRSRLLQLPGAPQRLKVIVEIHAP